MRKHRTLLCILIGLFAFPALARAETTACDLLTKADVEDVTGMQVTRTKVEDLSLCAGVCETTTGSRCAYIGTLAGASHTTYLDVELPPYMQSDLLGMWRRIAKEDKGQHTTEMQIMGRPAFWTFDRDYAFLHIFDGDEVHFLIWEGDITRNDIALQHAQAMAARVYDRYLAAKRTWP